MPWRTRARCRSSPAASGHLQGFARVVNHASEAWRDTYRSLRRCGPPTRAGLTVGRSPRNRALQLDDLAVGNPAKGLDRGVGSGEGDWRQRLTSALDIEVLAYMRTTTGS